DVPRERTGVILGRGGYIGVRAARAGQHFRQAQQLVQSLKDLVPDLTPEQLASVKQEFLSKLGHYGGDTAIGLVPNIAASRIANRFDLGGPAYTVDAACASSLIALDQGARELETGRADMVIAGGMHVTDDLSFWNVFTQLGAVSRTQQIRPFDRRADGLLIGEGVGILVLKRLADAERAGDRIYAVIRGMGVASDGRERSLMDPRSEGQILALERAWKAAGVDPGTVGLLEAHGTGTPAGDQSELTTLARFFGDRTQGSPGMGTVKSMIGHTMPAAGAAGVIKAALAIHYGFRPPTLHCDEPHDLMGRTGFHVIRETEEWERTAHPRRAAVNAFGFGGINAHAVLEAAPGASAEALAMPRQPAPEMLFIAADGIDAVLAALAAGVSTGTDGPCRLVVENPTAERRDIARKLVERGKRWSGRKGIWFSPEGLARQGGKVAFMFPGVDGRFSPNVEDVARWFGLSVPKHHDARGEDLVRVGAGIVEVGLMLNRVLREIGVRPDAIAGHSIGEWTGMLVSGLSAEEEADRFIAEIIPSLSVDVPGVAFGAAGCGVEQAEAAIADLDRIALSHDNCPHQIILCGVEDSMDVALERLKARGVLCEKLPFRSGFHSPLFREYLEPLKDVFSTFSLHPPHTPMWSATRVTPYPSEPDEVQQLWIDHLLQPVRFRELTERLYAEGFRVFIQVGTGRLVGFVEDSLRGRPHAAITANAEGRPGMEQLRHLAAELWCEGYDVRLDRLGIPARPAAGQAPRPGGGVRLELSTHLVRLDKPLELPRTPASRETAPVASVDTSEPVLAELARMQDDLAAMSEEVVAAWTRLRRGPGAARRPAPPAVTPEPTRPTAGPRTSTEMRRFSLETMPDLVDHAFIRQPDGWEHKPDTFPVVPFTLSVETVLDAAQALVPELVAVGLERVRAKRWIEVAPPQDVEIKAAFDGSTKVAVDIGEFFSATVIMARSYPPAPVAQPLDTGPGEPVELTAPELYEQRVMFHGPRFQAVTDIGPMGPKGLHGVVTSLPARGSLLDAAGQIAGYWCVAHSTRDQEALPFRVDRMTFYGPHPEVGARVECDVRILEFTDQWGRFDIDMHRDGRVWVRIEGWEDRRFESDPRMRRVLLFPENHIYAEPDPDGFFIVRETWRSAASRYFIARRWLGWQEFEQYDAKNPRDQRSWLLGRIALKDAVRQWLWDRGHGNLYQIEIAVDHDAAGRPQVSGPFGEDLRVSVSHKQGMAVAMVAEGEDVGIDLERIEPRDEAFVRTAFVDTELALLPAAERDEWLTRLWVAKEAVGKLRGTGLGGRPRDLVLTEIDGERLRVDGVWVRTRLEDGHVIGWTGGDSAAQAAPAVEDKRRKRV
ncbi:MAG: beta-ketoacyl synthase N-terminal-like domain-containing protein, partial [Chromatiales bacterium]